MGRTLNDKITIIVVSALFFILGATMVVAGVTQSIQRSFRMQTYLRTEGIVCDYDVSYSNNEGNNTANYTAIYSYTIDGKEYTCRDNVGHSAPPNPAQTEIILYNPADPAQSFVEQNALFQGRVLPFGGLIIIIVSCLILSGLFNGRMANRFRCLLFALFFILFGIGLLVIIQKITFPLILLPVLFIIFGLILTGLSFSRYLK